MRGARLLQLTLLALSLALPLAAQSPTDNPLTNADIVKMMKAGIPEAIIVREIQMSNPGFNTSANALIDLKNHGASERILGAVLDSRSGAGNPLSEPVPASRAAAQSAAPGPHRLPTFQADLRIKSNKVAKVAMSQNHIKVEQGGAPLFDLKWKAKPAR